MIYFLIFSICAFYLNKWVITEFFLYDMKIEWALGATNGQRQRLTQFMVIRKIAQIN